MTSTAPYSGTDGAIGTASRNARLGCDNNESAKTSEAVA